MQAYLDTQIVLRLAVGDLKRLSRNAKNAIERYDLVVSPMVRLELKFLQEMDRIALSPEAILLHLEEKVDLQVCPLPFDRISRAACFETWTRDAFDRVIVAHARCAGDAYLISADENIRAHYDRSVW